jgi:hypothetical protein
MSNFHPNIKNLELEPTDSQYDPNITKYRLVITDQKFPPIGIDKYFPINYPELLQALLPYLKLHDVLKLLRLCKGINLAYFAEDREIKDDVMDYKINAMEHNCVHCVGAMVRYSDVGLLDVFKVGCKYGHVESINKILIMFSENEYPKDDIDTYVNDCVTYAFNHDPSITVILLEFITKLFGINNTDTLKLVCKLENKNIINNIDKHAISYDASKIILPIAFKYNMDMCIDRLLNHFHYGEKYLMDLIRNDSDMYNDNIITLLLKRALRYCYSLDKSKTHKDDINIIRKLGERVTDVKLLMRIMSNNPINANLIPHAYKLGISDLMLHDGDISFLGNTKELNLLSIRESIKNNGGPIYTNCLTTEELLCEIINCDNTKFKKILIECIRVNDKFDMINDKMKTIIGWVALHGDDRIVEHLFELKYLNIDLKCLILHKIRKECGFTHRLQREFVSDLTFEDLMRLMITTPNKSGRGILSEEFRNRMLEDRSSRRFTYKNITKYDNKFINTQGNSYNHSQNMLFDNYEDDDFKNLYDDNDDRSFTCKIKMSKKLLNLNYTKLLLEIDESYYYEIFDKVSKLLWVNYPFPSGEYEVTKFLMDDPKFCNIKPSIVFKLIAYHVSDGIDTIVTKHNFFKQFLDK